MSTISAGTSISNGLVHTADQTGNLVIQTNGSTTAVSFDTSQNATFTGAIAADGISVGGNDTGSAGYIEVYGGSTGEGGEVRIYTSAAEDTVVNNWSIDVASDDLRIFNNLGDMSAGFIVNGGVELYYDNSKKFTTSSQGATFLAGITEEHVAVTSSSNSTILNCTTATSFSHTLTENTTFTFNNPSASGTATTIILKLVQDASASGYTVTWPSSVDWPSATAPTLTATASAVDYFMFTTNDGGTTWYGFTAGQAMG